MSKTEEDPMHESALEIREKARPPKAQKSPEQIRKSTPPLHRDAETMRDVILQSLDLQALVRIGHLQTDSDSAFIQTLRTDPIGAIQGLWLPSRSPLALIMKNTDEYSKTKVREMSTVLGTVDRGYPELRDFNTLYLACTRALVKTVIAQQKQLKTLAAKLKACKTQEEEKKFQTKGRQNEDGDQDDTHCGEVRETPAKRIRHTRTEQTNTIEGNPPATHDVESAAKTNNNRKRKRNL